MFSNLDFKATFGLAIKVTLDSNMVGNLSLKVKKNLLTIKRDVKTIFKSINNQKIKGYFESIDCFPD